MVNETNNEISKLSATINVTFYTLSTLIIIGNSLTVVAIIKYRYLQTKTYILVCSLSLCDITVGLFTIVNRATHGNRNQIQATWIEGFTSASYQGSIFHLLVISTERYFAIIHPFQYIKHVTNTSIAVAIFFTWVIPHILWISLFFVHLHLGPFKWFIFVGSTSYLCIGIIIVLMYIKILHVVHKHATQIRSLSQESSNKNNFKSEMKATKTMALIVFSYSIFWAPVFIKETIEAVNLIDTNTVLSFRYTVVSYALLIWGTLNSGVNCIIYAWFNKDFRKAYNDILRCGRKSRNLVNTDSVLHNIG